MTRLRIKMTPLHQKEGLGSCAGASSGDMLAFCILVDVLIVFDPVR